MRTSSRRWLIAGALGVPAVAASLWFAWLPGRIEREVEARGRARGWDVDVGGVWPGLFGVDLEEVEASREGVAVDVDRIELDAGPFGLAIHGADAVESVRVVGGSVAITTELFAEDDDGPAESGGSGRTVELSGVALEIRDSHGVLASSRLSGRVSADAVDLVGERCRLGEAPSHQILANEVRLQLTREPGEAWRLAGSSMAGAELRIGRATDAAETESGTTDSDPEAEENVTVPATRERIESFFAMRPSDDGEPQAPDPAEPEPEPEPAPHLESEGEEQAWLDRVVDGAEIQVHGMAVVRVDEHDEAETVLRDLVASAKRDGERVHLQARAEGSGGSLRCDLRAGWDPPSIEGSLGAENLPFDVLLPFLPALPWHRPEEARVTIDVSLDAPSPAQVDVDGSASIRSLSFEHPRLASTPIREIALGARGHATLRPLTGQLELDEVTLTMGRAEATLSGELVARDGIERVTLHARLPPTRCDHAVGGIPRDLLAESAGFSWEGSLSGRLDLEVDMADLDATTLEVDLTDGCQFETVPAVADLRRVRTTFVHRVQEPDGSVFEMSTGPGTANWTSLVSTSPYLVHAVVGHEDAGFFSHDGFAVYAIRDALKRNLREGRYVVGASTITMQLAKNLFLHREKTIARKVQEVLLTWWLESALSKAEILELYLNVIEYGPGVYGITRASEHYFGRPPRELSPAEAAYLANVLPNPKGLQASYEAGHLTSAMRNRMTRFLNHLNQRGRIDAAALAYGLAELETLRFHQEGRPVPARSVPDGAGPLPVATAAAGSVEEDSEYDYENGESWIDAWAPMSDEEPDSDG